MKYIKFDSAYQKLSTGEMFVPASDDSGNLIRTKYFFQRVTQVQPILGADNVVVGQATVGLSPWAFATTETAADVYSQLKPYVPKEYTLSLEESDYNPAGGVRSHKEFQIVARYGNKIARINAGLLASNLARTTAFVDGKIKQFPHSALKAAAEELIREIEFKHED